jgi:transcriptional regulator with PAS, ATPase and Fis domain
LRIALSATNRDLEADRRSGKLRLDRYYRLGVSAPRLAGADIEALQAYDWPGSIRELENVIERAVNLRRGRTSQAASAGRCRPPGIRDPAGGACLAAWRVCAAVG